MHELRKDPIIGRWVIMAKARARRPGTFITSDKSDFSASKEKDCSLCEHHEKETLPEIFAIRDKKSKPNTKGWKVRVVCHPNPILKAFIDGSRTRYGLYDKTEGRGAHEIVVETPEHIMNMADLSSEQIELVLRAYAQRINDLEKDSGIKYVLAHKNYKWARGKQSRSHSYSEIIATPVTPLRVKEELHGAKKYFDYHERCIFCDLVKQESETRQRIVEETKDFIAVVPFASRFPFETWIIPKKHNCSFPQGVVGEEKKLAVVLKRILQKIKIGLDDPAYHFVIHSAPFLRSLKNSENRTTLKEDYHWHIEVMPRLTHAAGFEKGTGFYICPIPPEEAAEYLRELEI